MSLSSQTSPDVLEPLDRPAAILRYWRAAGWKMWFAKDPAFDRQFRESFSAEHAAAAARRCPAWAATAEGALALVLLLDQYPRNAFRGTPRMYATDALARDTASAAIAAGHDLRVDSELRLFFYLPFSHSENLADQDRAVALVAPLGPDMSRRAASHRGIIARFGRFPHRNAILGRTPTASETAWLADGGYAG